MKETIAFGIAALVLSTLGAFLIGFTGHIGSLHHATHFALIVAGVQLIVWGFFLAIVAIFGDDSDVHIERMPD